MPKIDIANLKIEATTGYPEPFRQAVAGRSRKRLGNAVGLDQFGVNLTTLHPGAASALRHWHANEDELVFVLEGEVILVEDDGETLGNLEIGSRSKHERVEYPDVDLFAVRDDNGWRFTHKNGDAYG